MLKNKLTWMAPKGTSVTGIGAAVASIAATRTVITRALP